MKCLIPLLTLLGLSFAQICPPPEVLSPCTCSESKKSIECMYIRGRFNPKEIFDRASPFVNESVVFERLFIYDTPVVEILENTFESLKFIAISMNGNPNLVYISPLAFNASRDVTEELVLSMDRIDNDSPYERDIFEFVSGFKHLRKLWIPSNRLTSIPDNAFHNLDSLEEIYIAGNRISKIGSRAFSGAPNLKSLGINSNSIPSDGLAHDAFDGISNLVEIDLTYNDMEFMEQSSFQSLLDQAGQVEVGGSSCGRNGCRYQYLHCDERADWICDNLERYEHKLTGFRCYGEFDNVFEYCRNATMAM